jgi:hypothetical protein
LEGLCDLLVDLNPQAEMSSQGLHQRFNDSAVTYLQKVFQLALRQQLEPVCDRLPFGALAPFGRVLLEDSTQCSLHEKLAEAFKGSGGSASTSAVKIDLIYEVLHHSLLELHLSDGTAADQGRALAIIPHLRAGDLVLRDLGYLSLESLRQIEAQEAWYLSRLSKGVDVYLEADAQAPALGLVEHLERYYPDDHVIDLPVYLGHERVPSRLLAYRLPEPVVQERRRKALEEARKKGRELSQEYLDWLSFGFYITNVSQQVWPSRVVGTVYRLRWQVEIYQSCNLRKTLFWQKMHIFDFLRLQSEKILDNELEMPSLHLMTLSLDSLWPSSDSRNGSCETLSSIDCAKPKLCYTVLSWLGALMLSSSNAAYPRSRAGLSLQAPSRPTPPPARACSTLSVPGAGRASAAAHRCQPKLTIVRTLGRVGL